MALKHFLEVLGGGVFSPTQSRPMLFPSQFALILQ